MLITITIASNCFHLYFGSIFAYARHIPTCARMQRRLFYSAKHAYFLLFVDLILVLDFHYS